MAPDLTIRQLDPRWVDAVEPLWLALRDHHHSVTADWGPVRDDADSWARRRADYVRWLAEDDAFCLVAREGGPSRSAIRPPLRRSATPSSASTAPRRRGPVSSAWATSRR